MKPNAKEAEGALSRAVQAQAIADLLAELLSAGPAHLDDHKLQTLSFVAEAICSLLKDVTEILERVRDSEASG